MNAEVVEGLKRLGLTEYEAKAYAALVGLGEATARKVHEASGVPRTRIYDVLRELTGKGFVEFIQGSPTCYRAIEPERVVERLKEELVEAVERSAQGLKSLCLEVPGPSPVWCIRGEWGIKNTVRDFLSRAGEELTVFCRSPELLREYKPGLRKDCRVKIIVDERERFQGLDLDLREAKQDLARLYQDAVIDGVSCGLECLMISQGRESLVICRSGEERLAVIIKLPIISMLQKAVLESMAASPGPSIEGA